MKELPSLKEFIEASLKDICEAVENTRQKHPYVSPRASGSSINKEQATVVDFDIAIAVTDVSSQEKEAAGKAGLSFKVGVLSGGAGFDASNGTSRGTQFEHASRVQFSVPVYFQYDEEIVRRNQESIKQYNSRNQGRYS